PQQPAASATSTPSLHDALPIYLGEDGAAARAHGEERPRARLDAVAGHGAEPAHPRVAPPARSRAAAARAPRGAGVLRSGRSAARDRKSTRLNSSHVSISYAVFC